MAHNVGSVVGLREALTWGHRPLRAVWGILVLAGLTATIFYIYRNTSEYLNREAATKVRVSLVLLHTRNTAFSFR